MLDRRRFGERFDAISAIAMINHIGPKNYPQFFATMHAVLKDRGLFLLQGIANRKRMYANDAFLDKYIFPGGVCASMAQLHAPAERYFTLEDFHNFTSYYPNTLRASVRLILTRGFAACGKSSCSPRPGPATPGR